MDAERNGLDAAWPAVRGMKESFCTRMHNACSLLDTFKCFQPQEKKKTDGGGGLPGIDGAFEGSGACVGCVMRCAGDPLTH